MVINVCIPTLNRYDLLEDCIASLIYGTLVPNIFVIDNGLQIKKHLSKELLNKITVHTPKINMGVAGSWNWFIKNVPEPRVITNDDIVFDKFCIELLYENKDEAEFVCPQLGQANQFSCFMIKDSLIKKIGYFDETISPNWGYFEDTDYSRRMLYLDIKRYMVRGALVNHYTSSTKAKLNSSELSEHHRKFKKAKINYIKKWGGAPGKETRKGL